MAVSGLPANDERAGESIRLGRGKMPGFGQTLSDQQINDLLAYLHTL
jgi:mono/diheme cytochrome c family protein